MDFNSPEQVESIAYDLKLGDWPRAQNRALVNELADGKPPYSSEEAKENNIKVNVSDLEHTRSLQHGRAQFYSAFLKPAHYFVAKNDSGPKHKRQEWNTIVTAKAAKIMKRSLAYFESMRSRFALDVLHGIGPSAWEDRDKWCPDPIGIEDVLIPADTLLTMKNLPFFFIYRSMTAPELIKQTTGPRVDPGWNLELVQSCLEWIDSQMLQMRNNNWPEVWSPEKAQQRIKSDGGWYAGDSAPGIHCFDFYFWNDEARKSGWRRRMMLDPWSTPEAAGAGYTMSRKLDYVKGADRFLFNPGKRVYATRLSELINFQFADLSAVAPFRYHSVRSLGWLLYAACHLQNRMRCRWNEHVFESLMQYFQGSSEEDFQRALKVELVNRGFIDKTIKMLPPNERWQVNAAMVELALNENKQIIRDASSAWSQNQNFSSDRTEKTKFQVMAEIGAITSMISSALMQCYQYQEAEYREIFRRLCKKNSRDKECQEFRAGCLTAGIPEEHLEPEKWEIESERTVGSGNKALEMAIAQQLLEMRNLYDSEAQREILRDVTLLVTDDAVRTRAYVPEGPRPVSNTIHDAELSMGAIMAGQSVAPIDGQLHEEVVEVWLAKLGKMVMAAQRAGGMVSPTELGGLKNLSLHIKKQMALVARDESKAEQVKQWADALGRLDNFLKAFEQRLIEQAKAAQQNGDGAAPDPKDIAKAQNMIQEGQIKRQNQEAAAGQRRAQRALEFEDKIKRETTQHAADLAQQQQQHAVDLQARALEAAHTIKTASKKSDEEPTT